MIPKDAARRRIFIMRNASVTLLSDGRVGRLSAGQFERWLLSAVIRPLSSVGARTAICTWNP